LTHTNKVYEQLKRAILVCALPPGRELRELALASELGVTRGVVRGALGRLVADGLVELRSRKGYRVSPLDLRDVREVFEMRLLLEPYAVEQAAGHAPREAIECLHDLAHSRYDLTDPSGYERYVVDNREFHVRIADAAGNRRLAHALGSLLEDMQRLTFLSLGRLSSADQLHEHHHLYDAILAGDAAAAREVCVQQIEDARRRVVDALLGSTT